jgi:hypothetical protein
MFNSTDCKKFKLNPTVERQYEHVRIGENIPLKTISL